MKKTRDLSGIFFREKVDGSWENICFEELPEESQDRILAEKSPEFVKNLAKMLAKTLAEVGDKFDISANG